jgi:hypothetical protein
MSAVLSQADAPLVHSSTAGSVPVQIIIEAVAAFYALDTYAVMSDRRRVDLVKARQITFWLCEKLTCASYAEIGRRFSRDHTTIMHGVKQVAARMPHDIELKQDLAAIEQSILATRDALIRIAGHAVPLAILQQSVDAIAGDASAAAAEIDRQDAARKRADAAPRVSPRAARIVEAGQRLIQAQKTWAMKRGSAGEADAIAAMTRAANTLETLIEGDQQ